jgi:hypothetical protein
MKTRDKIKIIIHKDGTIDSGMSKEDREDWLKIIEIMAKANSILIRKDDFIIVQEK